MKRMERHRYAEKRPPALFGERAQALTGRQRGGAHVGSMSAECRLSRHAGCGGHLKLEKPTLWELQNYTCSRVPFFPRTPSILPFKKAASTSKVGSRLVFWATGPVNVTLAIQIAPWAVIEYVTETGSGTGPLTLALSPTELGVKPSRSSQPSSEACVGPRGNHSGYLQPKKSNTKTVR